MNWIYREVRSGNEAVVSRSHFGRVTKNFSAYAPIPANRDQITKEYAEIAYPIYAGRRREFKLDCGVVDAYLDARAEGDYLETRGAKLAVALETLKAVYINQPGQSQYIIDECVFESARKGVQKAIVDALKAHGISRRKARRTTGNTKGLNRRSFRDMLDALSKEIGFAPHQKEIRLFVSCRNKLVHEGTFYCNAATDEERDEVPSLSKPSEEYFFLINFLDRIMLHLVGYEGQYRDLRYFGVLVDQWKNVTDDHWPHLSLHLDD